MCLALLLTLCPAAARAAAEAQALVRVRVRVVAGVESRASDSRATLEGAGKSPWGAALVLGRWEIADAPRLLVRGAAGIEEVYGTVSGEGQEKTVRLLVVSWPD